jgi:quercetin dioxygenase-like cupin family protein
MVYFNCFLAHIQQREYSMKILRSDQAKYTDEYGCLFRRLFTKELIPNLNWAGGWIKIKHRTHTTPHQHEMAEIFFVTKGKGNLIINGNQTKISEGDVIHVEANQIHSVQNNHLETLEVLCVWWPV